MLSWTSTSATITTRQRGYYPRLDDVTVYVLTVERMTGKETLLPAPQDSGLRLTIPSLHARFHRVYQASHRADREEINRGIVAGLAVLTPGAGAAEPQFTREQALRALANPDPVARRAAASRLGEAGRMADAAALVKSAAR